MIIDGNNWTVNKLVYDGKALIAYAQELSEIFTKVDSILAKWKEDNDLVQQEFPTIIKYLQMKFEIANIIKTVDSMGHEFLDLDAKYSKIDEEIAKVFENIDK